MCEGVDHTKTKQKIKQNKSNYNQYFLKTLNNIIKNIIFDNNNYGENIFHRT